MNWLICQFAASQGRGHICICAAIFFVALPGPARAEVIDVGSDGALTIYSSPGIYSSEQFRPIVRTSSAAVLRRTNYHAPNGEVGSLLIAAANKHAINLNLLSALAWNESRFESGAVSPKGAVGVMQLMKNTAQSLGVNRYDLSENIFGGAAYLKQMLSRYNNDVALALAAYNAGPEAVDRFHGIPPFHETRDYVQTIQSILARPTYPVPNPVMFVDP